MHATKENTSGLDCISSLKLDNDPIPIQNISKKYSPNS